MGQEIRLRILKSMVRGLEGAFSSSFRGVEDFVLFSRFGDLPVCLPFCQLYSRLVRSVVFSDVVLFS